MRNGSTIPDETGIHRNGYTNHPRIPKPNLPFIATLVLYLYMTLFRKLRLNRIRLQISNLTSHTSHPPKTGRLRSAPTTHFHSPEFPSPTQPAIHLPQTRSITQIRTRVLANQVSTFCAQIRTIPITTP